MSVSSHNLLVQESLLILGTGPNGDPRDRCLPGVLPACRSHAGGVQPVETVAVLTFALALGLSITCLAWGEAGGEQHQPYLCSDEEPLYALQGMGGRGLIWVLFLT